MLDAGDLPMGIVSVPLLEAAREVDRMVGEGCPHHELEYVPEEWL
jgi:hypothetical protein